MYRYNGPSLQKLALHRTPRSNMKLHRVPKQCSRSHMQRVKCDVLVSSEVQLRGQQHIFLPDKQQQRAQRTVFSCRQSFVFCMINIIKIVISLFLFRAMNYQNSKVLCFRMILLWMISHCNTRQQTAIHAHALSTRKNTQFGLSLIGPHQCRKENGKLIYINFKRLRSRPASKGQSLQIQERCWARHLSLGENDQQ